ncbi:hypothetical protein [Rhodopirellula bahusiensis]|uniref:hypothetical protein n=1 Tax=Rhodopirellula bahusiensis TaxID=2014065 RepID=UPI0032652641
MKKQLEPLYTQVVTGMGDSWYAVGIKMAEDESGWGICVVQLYQAYPMEDLCAKILFALPVPRVTAGGCVSPTLLCNPDQHFVTSILRRLASSPGTCVL